MIHPFSSYKSVYIFGIYNLQFYKFTIYNFYLQCQLKILYRVWFHHTRFSERKQISITYKQYLPSSTYMKIFKPHEAFPHKPFLPARLESTCWISEIVPNSYIFLSNGIPLWLEAISVGCLFLWEILPLDGWDFVTKNSIRMETLGFVLMIHPVVC